MKQYLALLQHVLDNGVEKKDRTGTGTLSVFGYQMRFNLNEGFPLVTTKKCHMHSIAHELKWFLSGDTNTQYLKDNNVRIWQEWEDENGDLGPVYGKQWRDWVGADGRHHDQIKNVVKQLKEDPDNRRIIISAWNVGDLDQMALAPCHSFVQFYTEELSYEQRCNMLKLQRPELVYDVDMTVPDAYFHSMLIHNNIPLRRLSCQLYIRSNDLFLGAPFNIASYALLTHKLAYMTNMAVGELVYTIGDGHIYTNHIEQVKLQLTRKPRGLPWLVWNTDRKINDPADFEVDDFEIMGYDPHPHIPGKVAI